MARVTVEDCLDFVENRFELVHVSAMRCKQLFKGSAPLLFCKNREIVTSLREIADGKVKVILAPQVDEENEPSRQKHSQKKH